MMSFVDTQVVDHAAVIQAFQTDSDTLSPVFRTSRGALSSLSAPTAQRAGNSPAVESAPAGAFYSPIVATSSRDDAAAPVPNPYAAATYYAMVAERDALAAKLSRVGAAGSRGIVKERKRLQALTHAVMAMEAAR